MNITIRPETRSDYEVISQLNDMAFGQENESILIESLRKKKEFIKDLSLLALMDGQAVGHILFFPVTINGHDKKTSTLSLAPMCVMPEFQGMGIGAKLVEKGLDEAKKAGFTSVIVLGHKDYYPRFGFKPASSWLITTSFEVPDENYMALELVNGSLAEAAGLVEYPGEFNEV